MKITITKPICQRFSFGRQVAITLLAFISWSNANAQVMVKDINPGSGNGGPSSFVYFNGTMYFGANDGINGFEMWTSDGTGAGTVLFKDISAGSSGSFSSGYTKFNGALFFRANDVINGLSRPEIGLHKKV